MDQVDESLPVPAGEQSEKEKKRRWRISRRKEELSGHTTYSNQNLGVNSNAEASTSTIGSGHGHRPRKSWTGDSSDVAATLAESEGGNRDGKDDSRGPLGWIKSKYREAKENADQKRTKSPPGEHGHGFLPTRGKSIDIKRSVEEKRGRGPDTHPEPHNVPMPTSPPPVPTTQDERARAS
jgi:hypothetical protein